MELTQDKMEEAMQKSCDDQMDTLKRASQIKRYRRKENTEVTAYQTNKPTKITTLEGIMCAQAGDYIVTGIKGEEYVCKKEIFEDLYEPIEEGQNE